MHDAKKTTALREAVVESCAALCQAGQNNVLLTDVDFDIVDRHTVWHRGGRGTAIAIGIKTQLHGLPGETVHIHDRVFGLHTCGPSLRVL